MRREKKGGMIGVISVEVESYPIIALLFLLLYRTQGLHFDRSRQRMKIMAIIIKKKSSLSLCRRRMGDAGGVQIDRRVVSAVASHRPSQDAPRKKREPHTSSVSTTSTGGP